MNPVRQQRRRFARILFTAARIAFYLYRRHKDRKRSKARYYLAATLQTGYNFDAAEIFVRSGLNHALCIADSRLPRCARLSRSTNRAGSKALRAAP
jgi:hypothetical protein